MKKNISLLRDILKNWLAYYLGIANPVPVGYVIISVTYACNAKCMMCNLHEFYRDQPDLMGKESDLTAVIKHLKTSQALKSIRHIDLTGGEPFIRKDLQRFISQLYHLPAIELVTINTNGILTKKIASDAAAIIGGLKPHQRFSVSVSIDGIGDLHDTIRGVPDVFSKIDKTITALVALGNKHPQFTLRSNAVLQPANIHAIDNIKAYWEKNNISGSFSVIQDPFYTHTAEINSKNNIRLFTSRDISAIKAAEPKSRGMNHYINRDWVRPLHCFAGYAAMCIDPFGTLYPCNFLTGNDAYAMGSIHDKGIDSVWSSSRAKEIRKKIKKCPYIHCWNGCEVDQTLKQFDPIDRMMRLLSLDRLSYYRMRGMGEMR
jgi:radical SAM protein with 4Fe4S-binding SPASM domain